MLLGQDVVAERHSRTHPPPAGLPPAQAQAGPWPGDLSHLAASLGIIGGFQTEAPLLPCSPDTRPPDPQLWEMRNDRNRAYIWLKAPTGVCLASSQGCPVTSALISTRHGCPPVLLLVPLLKQPSDAAKPPNYSTPCLLSAHTAFSSS